MKTHPLFFRTVIVLIICLSQMAVPLRAGWSIKKPFGDNHAGITIRTPFGRNGLGYEPLKKPLGNNGKNIEKWVSKNRDICIFIVATTAAIIIAQPELSAITWKSVAIIGGSDGFSVGVSVAARGLEPRERRESDEGSGSPGVISVVHHPEEPAAPSDESSRLEKPADEGSFHPGPSGHDVVGASDLRLFNRVPITLNAETVGVGHVWVEGIREQTTVDGHLAPRPFSGGPDRDVKRPWNMITKDSTTDWSISQPPSASITFFVTPTQLKLMKAEAERIEGEKGYNLFNRNCTTEALSILHAGGIDFPINQSKPNSEKTWVPWELKNEIDLFKVLHQEIEGGYLSPVVAP